MLEEQRVGLLVTQDDLDDLHGARNQMYALPTPMTVALYKYMHCYFSTISCTYLACMVPLEAIYLLSVFSIHLLN